jgi:AraC-like DNA-binding protein
MSHAATLLQSPGTPVKAVADALGFSDAFHFSRVSRRSTDLSPARFARSAMRE